MARSELADEYFNRSYRTVRGTPYGQKRVRYALFDRHDGLLTGLEDVLSLIRDRCGKGIVVRARGEGTPYQAKEVALTIEGPFEELVPLETEYLGLLGLSAAARNMADMVEAAAGVPVIDMAARHFPPELNPRIAVAAAVGGASGTSTAAGHAEAHARFGAGDDKIRVGSNDPFAFGLYGSIPHALNAVYEGSSVEAAAAYNERCPEAPLTVLIDFEGRERDVVAESVRRFGSLLHGIRLDTAGSRVHQGGHEKPDRAMEMRILSKASDRRAAQAALEKFGFGAGVTIEAAYGMRDLLDSLHASQTRLILSSGFNLEKVKAFKACNAPMDGIGSGSWVKFSMWTSDIYQVHENGQWVNRCKAGRADTLIPPDDLRIVLET